MSNANKKSEGGLQDSKRSRKVADKKSGGQKAASSEVISAPISEKKVKRGVLLIALGHHYYGMYAQNLAMSIKAVEPTMPIAVLHDATALSMVHSGAKFFDVLIPVKSEHMTVKGEFSGTYIKTLLPELSPFDETLYLDVDSLWLPQKKVSDLMNELKNLDFTMQCRGSVDLKAEHFPDSSSHWVKLDQLKAAYGVQEGIFYNLSSELIWFKKTKAVKEMFHDASLHFKSMKVNHTLFAGGVPDELPFAMSMLRHIDIKPHSESWSPFFWHLTVKKQPSPSELYSQFYGYSLGGNIINRQARKVYENLCQHYANQFGVGYWSPKDKRSFVRDRHLI